MVHTYDGFGGDLDGGYYNYPFFECGHPYMSAATTQKCNSLWPAVPANLGAAVIDDDGNPTFTTTYDPVTGAAIQTPIVVTDPFAGKRGFLVGKTIRDLYDDPRGPRSKGNQDLLSYTVALDGKFDLTATNGHGKLVLLTEQLIY